MEDKTFGNQEPNTKSHYRAAQIMQLAKNEYFKLFCPFIRLDSRANFLSFGLPQF
jgi:hypothetical protein